MKIIVDNILTDNTVEEYTDELDRLFPEKIRETKLLKRGGLLIQPISAEAYNNILKHKTEFNNTIFGPLPYVHIQESKDLQQWLCVNKDTDTVMEIPLLAFKVADKIQFTSITNKIITIAGSEKII